MSRNCNRIGWSIVIIGIGGSLLLGAGGDSEKKSNPRQNKRIEAKKMEQFYSQSTNLFNPSLLAQYRQMATGLIWEFDSPTPRRAANVFYDLYHSTGSPVYLKRAISILLAYREYKLAEKWSKGVWDREILKLHLLTLIFQKKFREAEELNKVMDPSTFYSVLLNYLGSNGKWDSFTNYSWRFYRESNGSEESLKYLITGLLHIQKVGIAQQILEGFLNQHPHNLYALSRLEVIYRELYETNKLLNLYRNHPTPSNLVKGARLLMEAGKYRELKKWIKNYRLPTIWKLKLAFREKRWQNGWKIIQQAEKNGTPKHGEEWYFYHSFFKYKLHPNRQLLKKIAKLEVVHQKRELGIAVAEELIKLGFLKEGEEVVATLLTETGQFDWGLGLMGLIRLKEGRCEDATSLVEGIVTTDPDLLKIVEQVERCKNGNNFAKNP